MSANILSLDRIGIFKARLVSWKVQKSANSKSVGINQELLIVSEYVQGVDEHGEKIPTWTSWENYEPHRVYNTTWIIGREGKPNQSGIEQLVRSFGWDGNLQSVMGDPPDVVVQVTVKEEEYEGKTYYKGSWVNPEDHVPGPGGASPEEVAELSTQFGSLLRAAAGAAKKTVKPSAPAKTSAPAKAAAPKPSAPSSATAVAEASAFDRAACIAGLLEESIRANVKASATALGLKIEKEADVHALPDAMLVKLQERVFDDALPF